MQEISTRCCIVGGGPAGMMAGFLLARAGVPVLVLEKHADFLRDFRGDTVHPSTTQVMSELGLLGAFLQRPHQRMTQGRLRFGERDIFIADFARLRTGCPFVAFMPQWDFLNFLVEQARRFPSFSLRMRAEVTGLVREDGRVAGVTVRTPDGELTVRAELVIGADGRHSRVREEAGLVVENFGAPIDVLWMRLPRRADDPDLPLGFVQPGRVFVMFSRGDYYQCGLVIRKGGFAEMKERGLPRLREEIARLVPLLRERTEALSDWNAMGLLTVRVDRLRAWCVPGLLCIGDAAHAMSPVGGIGINLAIQDAVAAANLLWKPLNQGRISAFDLRHVQARRAWPTALTQRVQIAIQDRILNRALTGTLVRPPFLFRLFDLLPPLRRLTAQFMGVGIRPEHVASPEKPPSPTSAAV